jgi:5-hydroxyisourate hydrolase
MPTHATARVQALSNQLHVSPITEAKENEMPTEKKPPITCHVLDTTLGRPAANIPVTLALNRTYGIPTHADSTMKFSGTTNGDGRVTFWTPSSPFTSQSLEEVYKEEGDQKWSLTFGTEGYFGERGVKTFFPEVEVKFLIRQEAKGEHYHVPVLLGPFGYTTYRGS